MKTMTMWYIKIKKFLYSKKKIAMAALVLAIAYSIISQVTFFNSTIDLDGKFLIFLSAIVAFLFTFNFPEALLTSLTSYLIFRFLMPFFLSPGNFGFLPVFMELFMFLAYIGYLFIGLVIGIVLRKMYLKINKDKLT